MLYWEKEKNISPEKMAAADKPSSKGQAWFCTTGLPTDIVIEVEDMTFHLHKFPLMSKSRKLHELIQEQETNPSTAIRRQPISEPKVEDEDEDEDEIVEVQCHITLTDFPGGSQNFELAAKFCYGIKIELSPSNVALLRCAGEYLEMTEEFSEDNLISKTERFLSQSVLKNIKDSIKALKSCERLMPLAEASGITQRCIDSIVGRAAAADPSLFGWPVNGVAKGNETRTMISGSSVSKQIFDNGGRTKGLSGRLFNGESWFEDLTLLSLPFFKQLIFSMRDKGMSPEIIETCIMFYAKKYIPGVSRSNRKPSNTSSASSSAPSEIEQRELLETVVSNLPLEKSSRSSTTATRFLFGLLRTANILNATEACRASLERKIGLQLEEATLDDLLIPSYSYLNETLYDVECVERILSHFLEGFGQGAGISEDDEVGGSPVLMLVGKLIDGYLSEIASDANLKPEKFCSFAILLPDQARLYDDGLYRAVDVYLKSHPWISEAEREKICAVMDFQKLTLEACTHAAQSERLPLRAVVQVLFFEQLQLRHAIAGTLMAADTGRISAAMGMRTEEEEDGESARAGRVAQEDSETWREAVRENQVLLLDMDSMRTRLHQLERECSSMKKVIEKIDKEAPRGSEGTSWRTSLTRKFGCKFKTQVCDSHEPPVVDARRGRPHSRNHHLQRRPHNHED